MKIKKKKGFFEQVISISFFTKIILPAIFFGSIFFIVAFFISFILAILRLNYELLLYLGIGGFFMLTSSLFEKEQKKIDKEYWTIQRQQKFLDELDSF